MKVNVLDFDGKVVGDVELSDDVFAIDARKDIIARVVLWQLAKRRSDSHSVKGKSDVHGTTRKMYKQKGTGGARHGSKKAAQFRHGGVVFGPVARDYSFNIQKKVRQLGLKMSLSAKARDHSLILVDSFPYNEILKTKDIYNKFRNFGNSLLFVGSCGGCDFKKSVANIHGYDYLPQIGLNVYDIIKKQKLICSVDSIKALEDRLL